jgi:iron(III) transport system ATP-binding protein
VIGLPRPEKLRKVREVLKQVGLGDKEDRDATMLSGGEQQRVALARALVQNPEIVLFDEPLSNLDAKLRREMRGEIKSLQQRLGMTALYVTHDQEEALFLSDSIALMQGGRIVDEGSPYDLYEHPHTYFGMHFMGQCNSWEVLVTEAVDGMAVVEASEGIRFRSSAGAQMRAGMKAWLAIRPHHVEALGGKAPEFNGLMGKLVLTSFLGSYFEHRLETPLGPVLVHSRRPLAKDDVSVVPLSLPVEHLRLYPQNGV